MDMAAKQQFNRVFIDIITDGRDTPPKVIQQDLPKLEEKIKQVGFGKIASVMGRFYAMDRDKRWERTEKAFKALTSDQVPQVSNVNEAIARAYQAGKNDEFIEPVAIAGAPRIKPNDAVIFYNYRSDRVRQISDYLIDKVKNIYFVSFTSYGQESTPLVKVAFLAEKVLNQLAMVLSNSKLNQLHIAETEKYAHVTYFFNGGWEAAFAGEERILVPSPKVATYDLAPQMSAKVVAEKFIQFYKEKQPQFTVLNFANPDMVGHTGIFKAACQAVAATDIVLGQVAATVLNSGGDLMVTADHGNAEQMVNPQTHEVDKEHTTNPVPLILAFQNKKKNPTPVSQDVKMAYAASQPTGVLADVTATILTKLGLVKPEEITGQDLGGI
jgi:2,3-bisphosphoglycerate-independent phosphoglycerate mutase